MEPGDGITVLADDTDIFILMLHHCLESNLCVPLKMESLIKDRAVLDIHLSIEKHSDIIPHLLSMHALSGCDTVACCYGIGKSKAMKVVKSGYTLSLLGKVEAPFSAVIKQASSFMAACYGVSDDTSMSEARLKIWAAKTGKGYISTPKLCSLPPTTEAFELNVRRAHLQAYLWRSLESDQPKLDPEEFGWKKEESNKTLIPVALCDTVALAPASVLHLLKCSCESTTPCSTQRCGCRHANMICTVFCSCYQNGCANATRS